MRPHSVDCADELAGFAGPAPAPEAPDCLLSEALRLVRSVGALAGLALDAPALDLGRVAFERSVDLTAVWLERGTTYLTHPGDGYE